MFNSAYLSTLADKQHNILLELKPRRGDILDRNLSRLAVDYKVSSVYAVPREIEAPARPAIAEALARTLDIGRGEVLRRLSLDKSFIWIAREVAREKAEAIKSLGIKGVCLVKEYKRFYPKSALASHVIGFAGIDDSGLEGLELVYDGYLQGSPGWRWTVRDAKRRALPSEDARLIPPAEGLDIVLTIDEVIQHIAERELEKVYAGYGAKSATIIVMDPHTGDVLAMANRPTFDLNAAASSEPGSRRNRAVTDMYEPGSVYKIVTASCAVEMGAVALEEEIFCENGEYRVGGHVLHDHRPYAELTFRQIVEKSSNIGVAKVAQDLGEEDIYRFSRLFGFGQPTGIDLPGEVGGVLRPVSQWSALSIASVPIGHELAVTSTQMICAMAAIANGGYLVKPRLVSRIINNNGDVIKSFSDARVRRVLSGETAHAMRDILKGAVDSGTGVNAGLRLYTVSGKTGTAQKLEEDGSYSHSKFIASFVGFAPAEEPVIAVLVTVDEPGPVYYGGSVAAPVFREAVGDILKYLQVEPDKDRENVSI